MIPFLNTIRAAYSKAPYYPEIIELLERIILNDNLNLSEYIEISIIEICTYLGIETNFLKSSEIPKNNELRGPDKVVDICKTLNASDYVNMIGGVFLYNFDQFNNNGINLYFLKTNNQFCNASISNLSIIDTLMFNNKDKIQNLLKTGYELIKANETF